MDSLKNNLVRSGHRTTRARVTVDVETASSFDLELEDKSRLQITVRLPGTGYQRTRIQFTPGRRDEGADLLVQSGPDCTIELARMVERDDRGRPQTLLEFAGEGPDPVIAENLNPEVPEGVDPGGVAVATIDTGIAYTLPAIAARLARDGSGRIIGRDFTDGDDRPFDLDPSRPPISPIRHGTAVASILLREAPEVRVVPVRYPAGSPEKFAEVVTFIAATPARIVSMAIGGSARAEWEPFAAAVRAHPEMLFIVSAGNNGRDIDVDPVFPASFDLDNVIVVTSTDAFGRLARESNWGAHSVDIAVPGERIDVIDHRGARGKASGTSYAVPRVAALAARLSGQHPEWSMDRVRSEIMALAAPAVDGERPVARGWIPNPAIE